MFSNFFENLAVYEILLKNTAEPGWSQTTKWRMCIACWIPEATHTHTQTICNTYCSSTATTVARTRLNFTLYVLYSTVPFLLAVDFFIRQYAKRTLERCKGLILRIMYNWQSKHD